MNALTLFTDPKNAPAWQEATLAIVIIAATVFIFWHIANYPGE